MGNRKYAYFGEQVQKLVDGLVLEKRWTKAQALDELVQRTGYVESTVYRWGQGRLLPPPDTVKILAEIGRHKANLDREWGMHLFEAADHSLAEQSVIDLWGAKELRHIPNNLPRPEHTVFIGRQAELKRLLELLSPNHAAHLISIDGIGGVGKTALILEAAYRCLRVSTGEQKASYLPTFDAIIFVSAKQEYLTAYGILPRQQTHRTLRDIFHEVARALDRPEITRSTPEEQAGRTRNTLARQRTLLVVDNLETMVDQQEIITFLYDLPPSVKAVITTRERALFSPIRLLQLPEEEGLALIQHEAQSKMVSLEPEQTRQLYQHTGGVPAAMIYAIGQLAGGYSMEGVIERLKKHEGDVARFCFEGSIAPQRGQPAHHLLMAMAMFPKRPLREAVIYTAGLEDDPITADDGLARLVQLSLATPQDHRYQMLPLTREYGLAELAMHHEFENDARERWTQWYLDFAEKNGGRDWQEWHIQYDHIEQEWENFLAVFNWCVANEHFSVMKKFWNEDGLEDFATIYGRWDDQLILLDWLIQAAERRGEWDVVVQAICEKAWPLILMGRPSQLQEAQKLLMKAWQYQEFSNPYHLTTVTNHIVTLRVRQRDYPEAFYWTNIQENFIEQADFLDDTQKIRRWIACLYHRAEAYYGVEDYSKAEELYHQVTEYGQAINWQRAAIYAQNWLADLAVARDDLAKADSLLKVGLPTATRNKDKRRIAFYQRSYAFMKQKRGELTDACQWAEKALDGFDRLGMQPEADEMRNLIDKLNHP